jgi:hypothetical protein
MHLRLLLILPYVHAFLNYPLERHLGAYFISV